MITNLLASIIVSLVTNVTTTDNEIKANQWGIVYTVNPPIYDNGARPATERYETTTVHERRSLKCEVEGKPVEHLLSERLVSSVTKSFALRPAEWVVKDIKVNDITPKNEGVTMLTNLGAFIVAVTNTERWLTLELDHGLGPFTNWVKTNGLTPEQITALKPFGVFGPEKKKK